MTQAHTDPDPLSVGTQAYEDEASSRVLRSERHNLGPGDEVDLPGGPYRVERIISSEGETAEAVIYLLRDSAGAPFALKLYYEFYNPKLEPNPEALARIQTIRDTDVLRLHSFGTGAAKFRNRFCYEICDYAAGGTLLSVPDLRAKYTPSFVREHVVPEIVRGIQTLHAQHIYHCDLKPQNVFYLDREQTDLVIGDYGSAKTHDEVLSHTTMVKGSHTYLPPEQARGIVSEKNDYYSLGMTLVHLLYPEMITKDGVSKILERQQSGQPIVNFRPELKEFNDLIGGLTLVNQQSRWGASEVARWLQGERIEVSYGGEVEPIRLGRAGTIRTKEDLVRFIEEKSNWYEVLFADEDVFALLRQWLARTQDVERKKVFEQMVRIYQQEGGEGYVKEAVLRYFEPERPIRVEMKVYDLWGAADLVVVVETVVEHLDDLWKTTSVDQLKLYMFQLECSLRQLAEQEGAPRVSAATALAEKVSAALGVVPPKAQFLNREAVWHRELTAEKVVNLAWAFNKGRGFLTLNGCTLDDLESIAQLFIANPAEYDVPSTGIELTAYLRHIGRTELAKLDLQTFIVRVLSNHIRHTIQCSAVTNANGMFMASVSIGMSIEAYTKAKGLRAGFAVSEILTKAQVPYWSRTVLDHVSPRLLTKHIVDSVLQNAVVLEVFGGAHIAAATRRELHGNVRRHVKDYTRRVNAWLLCGMSVALVAILICLHLSARQDVRQKSIDAFVAKNERRGELLFRDSFDNGSNWLFKTRYESSGRHPGENDSFQKNRLVVQTEGIYDYAMFGFFRDNKYQSVSRGTLGTDKLAGAWISLLNDKPFGDSVKVEFDVLSWSPNNGVSEPGMIGVEVASNIVFLVDRQGNYEVVKIASHDEDVGLKVYNGGFTDGTGGSWKIAKVYSRGSAGRNDAKDRTRIGLLYKKGKIIAYLNGKELARTYVEDVKKCGFVELFVQDDTLVNIANFHIYNISD